MLSNITTRTSYSARARHRTNRCHCCQCSFHSPFLRLLVAGHLLLWSANKQRSKQQRQHFEVLHRFTCACQPAVCASPIGPRYIVLRGPTAGTSGKYFSASLYCFTFEETLFNAQAGQTA